MLKTQRVNVSKDVQKRLKRYGHTFRIAVDNLVDMDVLIEYPVTDKIIEYSVPISVSKATVQKLLEAKHTLRCHSLSNVIESILNANPPVPARVEYEKKLKDQSANCQIRIKMHHRVQIQRLAAELSITQWEVVQLLLETYEETLNENN